GFHLLARFFAPEDLDCKGVDNNANARENDHFEDSDVINCNETGIYFDTPPWYILAQKGGDASISHSDKSCRLTAVLAAKRN
ncbi:unnamed protein product, partial [Aphanomyces euteiches]